MTQAFLDNILHSIRTCHVTCTGCAITIVLVRRKPYGISIYVHKLFYKNTNHQQMHKESFIIDCNTLLHVSTLLGHLQGELFVTVTLRLHFIVE
jgi:hypothetical protein